MKAAHILATYFGERRSYPYNKAGVCEVINKQISTLKDLNMGYDTDLIIVNHDNQDTEAHDFLNSIEGMQLKNGIVRILHRPIINQDLSFGSYKYAYHMLKSEYDYWFFNEDDILPQSPNLINKMIGLLESNPIIGFVAALKFTNCIHEFTFDDDNFITSTGNISPHAHGGVGLTSTRILEKLENEQPSYFNTPNILHAKSLTTESVVSTGGYNEADSEVEFTNILTQLGYKLVCSSDGTDFIRLQDGRIL